MLSKRYFIGVILLLTILSYPAWADTVVLKTGQKLSGKMLHESADGVLLKLTSGKVEFIEADKIKEIITEAAGEVSIPLPKAKLPALQDSLTKLAEKLFQINSRAGMIAQVRDTRVYITLGSQAGVKVGDEFEVVRKIIEIKDPLNPERVIGRDREVVGRIRVFSVQPELAVCELVSGQAEQKNKSREYNQVLPPEGKAGQKICLGEMDIGPAADVKKMSLVQALSEICQSRSGWELVGPDRADYELIAQAAPAESGSSIILILKDRKSGQALIQNQGFHKTKLNAEELGYGSALSAELGITMNEEPVRKALEEKYGQVFPVGSALFIEDVGPQKEDAWVFEGGRLVIAGDSELSSTKQVSQLTVTWEDISTTIANVTAALSAQELEDAFRMNLMFYTVKEEQYQNLYVKFSQDARQWVLNWPAPKPTWAVINFLGLSAFFPSTVTIDNVKVISATEEAVNSASLSGLQFGEHTLNTSRYPKLMILEAFFSQPDGKITLYDQANKSVATRAMYSQPLKNLYLPPAK